MSNLFDALKALGIHASNIPLYVKEAANGEFFIHSAIGSFFLCYKLSNLALIWTSDRIEENILSITGHKNLIFCGCETAIYGYIRQKHIVSQYRFEGGKNWRVLLSTKDEGYLCGVNDDNRLIIWHTETTDVFREFAFPKGTFTVSHLLQPSTYKNKIIVVAKEGQLQLINYVKNNVLYMFQYPEYEFTAACLSPEPHFIALGTKSGIVLILDLLHDIIVHRLHNNPGSITAIGFRVESLLLAGTDQGVVTTWDFVKERMVGEKRELHAPNTPVATLFCVPSEPILISSGPDNSIRVWNYDRPDNTPQLLRFRAGHQLPPRSIRCWSNSSRSTTAQILTAGADGSLIVWNTLEEKSSFSMGSCENQNSANDDRINRGASLAVCPARDGWWDSIALCLAKSRFVSTWSFSRRTKGRLHLDWNGFKNRHFVFHHVTANRVAISRCGNFICVGYSSGHTVKYNLQSGLERGVFQLDKDSLVQSAGAVIGLEIVINSNRMVVLVAYETGRIALYDIKSTALIASLKIGEGSSQTVGALLLQLHPSEDFAAIVGNDDRVYLLQLSDFIVYKVIKITQVEHNATEPITSISFAHHHDLMIVSQGNLIKTFDFMNNKLVDCFRLRKKIIQLEITPCDNYLVTIHDNDLGVYIWTFKLFTADTNINLLKSLSLDYVPEEFQQPSMLQEVPLVDEDSDNSECSELLDSDVDIDDSKSVEEGDFNSDNIAKLSGLPLSYITNLQRIEQIRVRNEKSAKGLSTETFFIPQLKDTLDGIKWIDDEETGESKVLTEITETVNEKVRKRKKIEIEESDIRRLDNFQTMLMNSCTDKDYDQCMKMFMALSPTGIDYEIKCFDPFDNENGFLLMDSFLKLLDNQFKRLKCIDICLAYYDRFLMHHMRFLKEPVTEIKTGIEALIDEERQAYIVSQRDNTLQLITQLHKSIDNLKSLIDDISFNSSLCRFNERKK